MAVRSNDLIKRKEDYSLIVLISVVLSVILLICLSVSFLLKQTILVFVFFAGLMLVAYLHNTFYFRKFGEIQITTLNLYLKPFYVLLGMNFVTVLIIQLVGGSLPSFTVYIINFFINLFIIYFPLEGQNRELTFSHKRKNKEISSSKSIGLMLIVLLLTIFSSFAFLNIIETLT